MKKIIFTISLMILPAMVFADVGEVVKEDVCGSGNSIIETTDGWYIAAEHYSGVFLYEGDVVYGTMKTDGMQTLTRKDGEEGSFYTRDQ
jgi:hypothetical protein